MIGSFKFNNVESSSFNLVCKSVKRPLLPALKLKRVELPGASGAYDFEDEEYSLRTITMKIQYIGTDYEELRSRARSIAAWLSYSAFAQLIINDETDKCYLAKVTSEVDLDSLFESGSADVSFDCQPFAYALSNEVVEFTITGADEQDFVNPGTRHINYKSPQGSYLTVIINGSFTDLSLSINGNTLTYSEAINGILIIDCIEMEALYNDTNVFDKLGGDIDTFFRILPGDNTVIVDGTNLAFDLTISYLPMWI
jgi:predicted phage tail component-like protein